MRTTTAIPVQESVVTAEETRLTLKEDPRLDEYKVNCVNCVHGN